MIIPRKRLQNTHMLTTEYKQLIENYNHYIRWSDVTVICGYIAISMLWGNTAYCVKLSGEDLSRYSNKTESVALIKKMFILSVSYIRKRCHNNKHFSELASHHGGKTAGIHMVWRNYVTLTLCRSIGSDFECYWRSATSTQINMYDFLLLVFNK